MSKTETARDGATPPAVPVVGACGSLGVRGTQEPVAPGSSPVRGGFFSLWRLSMSAWARANPRSKSGRHAASILSWRTRPSGVSAHWYSTSSASSGRKPSSRGSTRGRGFLTGRRCRTRVRYARESVSAARRAAFTSVPRSTFRRNRIDSAAASAMISRRARAAARWYVGSNRQSAFSSSASMSSAAAMAAQVEPSARRSAARDSTASSSGVTGGIGALGVSEGWIGRAVCVNTRVWCSTGRRGVSQWVVWVVKPPPRWRSGFAEKLHSVLANPERQRGGDPDPDSISA
ncbi:unnamed protein product [Gemmataceae bacterium]|nr:unnamed protein product [Gemmataceae bacterium]VTT99150.1 unnamed protein product [Gemmataceae bacterium]